MNASLVFRNIGRFLLLMALQILVFNNLYLGGYISLFVYIAFLLALPTNMGKTPLLLTAFASGIVTDLFCNVMGLHTCAAVTMMMVRILIGHKILTKGDPVEISTPSMYSVPFSQYIWYLLILVLTYSIVYFTLQIFSFEDFFKILVLSVLSTIGTSVMVLLYQLIFADKDRTHTVIRN